MILFLDNAESILDPAGPDSQEIYAIVEELTRFDNICVGMTSRISTVPSDCQRPFIPTLTMESACDIFYGIYKNGERSDIISNLVKQLDFHALSITLLATVASHSMWDYCRLAKEWKTKRAQVLRTNRNESLAATIELSLASQTFSQLTPSSPPSQTHQKRVSPSIFHKLIPCLVSHEPIPSLTSHKLAPSAREILEVVAFFPQGIDEDNLDWLFSTVYDRRNIFDQFCILSLTYRSDGFIRMLAPIRDYLGPQDPKSSLLLCATKDRYFRRLSVLVDPALPGFREAKWIASEDINVEHLLDVFTSIDPNASEIWDVCYYFLQHLQWYKPRPTVLGPKIEALSDDHPSKSACLAELSQLFGQVGNRTEQKRLLTHTLKLARLEGDEAGIGLVLRLLSEVNRLLKLYEEGIQQAKEALEIHQRLGYKVGQAWCLVCLAFLLFDDKQLDAAKDAASRAIDIVPEKDHFIVCKCHQLFGQVYHIKDEREKAIRHLETALTLASPSNSPFDLFMIHFRLSEVFLVKGDFGEASAHIEQAKSHAVDQPFYACHAMEGQARIWYRQGRLEEATSEASCAIESFEELGVTEDAERCRGLVRAIERAMENKSTSAVPTRDGELL